jgi:N-hydroxyarylamine O-acetyltransferase
LWERLPGEDWTKQHLFSLQPQQWADFTDMCHYHQSSPQSHFTRNRICSRATPEGRVTLSNMWLITTVNDVKTTQDISSDEEYRTLLDRYFGIRLAG